MIKKSIRAALLLMGLSFSVNAQSLKPPLELPDISFIGRLENVISDRASMDFSVREIEFSFQGYLYPSIRSDIFVAFHKEKDGKVNVELEEAYLTVSRLAGDLSAKLGKKLLGFGKINPLHAEQWKMVERPLALKRILGEEGLSGEGITLEYLLPIPFFLQFEGGAWKAAPHKEQDGAESEFPIQDTFYSTRIWSGVALSPQQEFELGISGLLGKGEEYKKEKDDITVYGLDMTYKQALARYQTFFIQAEAVSAMRSKVASSTTVWGGYGFVGYDWDQFWKTGVRLDLVKKESVQSRMVSIIASHQLTETTKIRFQYGYNVDDKSSLFYTQVLFGLGPHSHVLQ